MTLAIYTKCQHCHLFVEENYPPDVANGAAPYVHLHRGDDYDEVIDGSHEAEPSNQAYTLNYWRTQGPMEMRLRFVYADIEKMYDMSMNQHAGWNQAIDKALAHLDTLR